MAPVITQTGNFVPLLIHVILETGYPFALHFTINFFVSLTATVLGKHVIVDALRSVKN